MDRASVKYVHVANSRVHAHEMKNATLPPSKRSRIEHQMDRMIIFMFGLLFTMCLIGATLFAIWTKNLSPNMWYLAPDQAPTAFDPRQPILAGVYSFVTSFVLYGYLIPISLYVSLEMVKVYQACTPLSAPARHLHAGCEAACKQHAGHSSRPLLIGPRGSLPAAGCQPKGACLPTF